MSKYRPASSPAASPDALAGASATAKAPATRYRIVPADPAAHLFKVSVTVDDPDPAGQRFMLPAWIPGSYMIREFARLIVSMTAHDATGAPLAVDKLDKATWRVAPAAAAVTVTTEVYAWDLSVRGAHLDESHGFFNGSTVFLLPAGRESHPCEVDIAPPPHAGDWQVATALPQPGAPAGGPRSFGLYRAADYDELIDHPVEMGRFSHIAFTVCGATHHVAVTGRHRAHLARLAADLARICESQIRLFDPARARAPFDEYWFLVMAVGEGYGGLEHRASTALITARDDLPLAHEKKVTPAYRRFLGLASHEYFHAWNVKRIKPAAFVPYDLTRENYTRDLWFFEGITSYYDDLTLVRAGIIEPLAYLELVAENLGRVNAQPGRLRQSVADASFDAWVKYYRQDENAPNALVSYYQKGALIGLALDLTLRGATGGRASLDDVMRLLWREHGLTGAGVPEGGVQAACERVAGRPLDDFFRKALEGTGELDADLALTALFDTVGIELGWKVPGSTRTEEPAPAVLNAKVAAEPNGDARLSQVYSGGAALAAGLSAGDVVIAVDGLRVNAASLEKRLKSYPAGSEVVVDYFRRDELNRARVVLAAQAPLTCTLTMRDLPGPARAAREAWLGGRPAGGIPTEETP